MSCFWTFIEHGRDPCPENEVKYLKGEELSWTVHLTHRHKHTKAERWGENAGYLMKRVT